MAKANATEFATLIAFMAVLLLTITSAGLAFEARRSDSKRSYNYRQYKRYCERGGLHFFVYDLQAIIRAEITIIATTCIFCIGGGVLFTALMLVPLLFISLTQATYHIATRRQHWLCLGVTLIVTSFMAWMTYGHLVGMTLWLTALATGCIAGATTEGIRLALKETIERVPTLNTWNTLQISTSISNQASRVSKIMDKMTDPFTIVVA